MKHALSPKQVAHAMGVSESSLKRWCDRGILPFEKTPGGHRKLQVSDVVQFLRDSDRNLVHPEVLGLPLHVANFPDCNERRLELLLSFLKEGRSTEVTQLITQAYLSGQSTAELCDTLLCPVMVQIGECWDCGDVEIFQERNACELLEHALHEIRTVLPAPDRAAPLAIGGTLSGDHYRLPSRMVQLVMAELGWRSVSLGNNLPCETLIAAADQYTPRLFWVSLSHAEELKTLQDKLTELANSLSRQTTLVIGGRLLADVGQLETDRNVLRCHSLRELARLGSAIASPSSATA